MVPDTAVVTIDLHHGHLTPEIATLPVPKDRAEQVIDNTKQLVSTARDAGIPVVHVTTGYRDSDEILANPKWRSTEDADGDSRESISNHNILGSQGLEIVPELLEPEDIVTQPKKRYSPFIGTDFEFVLETHDIDRLVIAGVNTNTCVQCTCFEATNRDYEVVVVEDCVDSMDGEAFHQLGLKNIEQALGSVVGLDHAVSLISGETVQT